MLHGQLPGVTCVVYLWIMEDLRIQFIKNEISIFLPNKTKKNETEIWKEQINEVLRHAIF